MYTDVLSVGSHCVLLIHSKSLKSVFITARVKKKENDKDEDIKEEEREPKDRRCFQCGDTGHVRRDCPEYRHLKQRSTGAPGNCSEYFFKMLHTEFLLNHVDKQNKNCSFSGVIFFPSSSPGTNHREHPVHLHSPSTRRCFWKDQKDL